jgi:hypothetical protein
MNKMDKEQIVMKTAEVVEASKNPWDSIGGDYVRLERDKAKMLILTNWSISKIKKFKDDKGELKEQTEFSAEVLSEDGYPAKKVFSTTSINALKGLKTIFSKYWPDTTTPRMIRIKRMGEGKSTIYDIEEQNIAGYSRITA